MTERQLLIDLGNSRVKWVWASEGRLDTKSEDRGNYKDFEDFVRNKATLRPGRIRLSSVAPAMQKHRLVTLCSSAWAVDVDSLESRAAQGGVRNAYPDPAMLGVDRWLALVGAVQRYGAPVAVWDLGTASTLDAVDRSGQHLGGWILPGPETMLRSLDRDTGLSVPDSPESSTLRPGIRTSECIARGVIAAQLGALERFLEMTNDGSGLRATLVVAGGGAPLVLPHLDQKHVHDPRLVFRGMLVD